MMGRQAGDQSQLFYLFNLEERIRRVIFCAVSIRLLRACWAIFAESCSPSTARSAGLRSIPNSCSGCSLSATATGIRFERKLCEEVEPHLAYRWFCRLALDDKVPNHSTFSVNRHGRLRYSDIFRQLFEAVVKACMDAGLVKGEGFAVDASVMEADASRYHGKAPDEIDWSAQERQTRAVAEFLSGLDDQDSDRHRERSDRRRRSYPGTYITSWRPPRQ
jgi:hypothetical protein